MFFRILSVFLWKNIKRTFFYAKTIIFILAISIGILYLFASLGDFDPGSPSNEHEFDVRNEDSLLQSEYSGSYGEHDKLLYTPNSPFYTNLMELAGERLNVLRENVIGFHNLTELEKNMDQGRNGTHSTVLIFNNPEVRNPRTLNYIIRKKSNELNAESIFHDSVRQSKYYEPYNGFVGTEIAIEKTFIGLMQNNKLVEQPTIATLHNPMKLRRAPQKMAIELFAIAVLMSYMFLMLSFLLASIVEEKQDGIKEIINIATSYSYVNQVALFLIVFLIAFVIICGQFGYAIYYNTFDCLNIVFPFTLVVLYVCAMMSYTFFVSSFFDSVTYAALIGATFYIIPYLLFQWAESPFLLWLRWLFPISLISEGMEVFIKYRNTERCFALHDIFVSDHPVNGYSLLQIYIFLVLDCFVYLFLYYYLTNTFPGKTGTPRSIFFLCKPSFWRTNKIDQTATPTSFVGNDSSPTSICKVHELTKSFKKTICSKAFYAVKKVSFEIPKNRVTILLGHNGAGKTTTMSMITGIVAPSSGRISVDNEYDVNRYRSSIGYCPQHDVFISYMSCKEHLILFGRLRGLTKAEASEEADIILDKVRLTKNANDAAKTLSRGMRRRLCLACAVVGKTKMVILDEPSTGLDPESRRDLWDVILPLRKERSLFLTTHSMEEADVLGDKIIIMDHGNVVCQGTQMALKRLYGSGYRLKILMKDDFNMGKTLYLISKTIEHAAVQSETHPTLIISLPYNEMSKFTETLKALEDGKDELGIESISLSPTTMEEVFLQSASSVVDPLAGNDSDEVDSKYVTIENQDLIEKPQLLFINRFLAIFYKKFIFIKRKWIKHLIHFLLPIVGILIIYWYHVYANDQQNSVAEYEKFELNANNLNNPDVILVINKSNRLHNDVVDKFMKLAQELKLNPVVVDDIDIKTVFKDKLREDPIHYNEKTIGGIQIDDKNSHLDIIYQNNIVISHPFMINFANNLILRLLNIPDSKIIVSNHPVALNYIGDLSLTFVSLIPNTLPVTLLFYIMAYWTLPHTEEVTEFRIIQRISPWLFWISTFIFDAICHTLLSIVLGVVILICGDGMLLPHCVFNMSLAILVIGYAYIPLIYVYAKLFTKVSTAFAVLFYGYFIGWIASFFFLSEESMKLYPTTYLFFQFHPEFAIRFQLTLATLLYGQNPEDYNVERLLVVYLVEAAMLIIIIIFLFENIYLRTAVKNVMAIFNPIRLIRNACKHRKELESSQPLLTDPYVEVEKELVKGALKSNDLDSYALVASQLEKLYIDFPAVKGVNFTVKRGECFGLLGMNGAGKSSIFKMMTLNSSITKGDIFINGFHIKKHKARYQQDFGYCPEVDALIDCMTAFELLKYMAMLKGTPFANINEEVNDWIVKMDLSKFKHSPTSSYSGGTKRKLNTAISMISDPKLIFLDEPTSGVDPLSRRFMWKCIRDFQKKHQTVVLTSHSMDECEELCNRLAIMVTGEFKCLGNIQKLKLIFGTGFTLVVKVFDTATPKQIENLKSRISDLFDCNLRDDYAGTLAYNVLEKDIQWSKIFGKVYDFAEKHAAVVEDFTINEISLEDIFLQFRIGRENQDTGTESNIQTSRL